MTERFIRSDEVCAMIGLRRSARDHYVREGRFPPPVKLNGVNVWLLSEVLAWQQQVIEQRSNPHMPIAGKGRRHGFRGHRPQSTKIAPNNSQQGT